MDRVMLLVKIYYVCLIPLRVCIDRRLDKKARLSPTNPRDASLYQLVKRGKRHVTSKRCFETG